VLGDDGDRVAKLGEHFKTAPRQLYAALDRLIAIGDAADAQNARLPARRGKLAAEQLRSVFLDEDLRLEVQAGGEAEVFMIGPRVAIDATVLAAAVRIDAGVEADVGAVVGGD